MASENGNPRAANAGAPGTSYAYQQRSGDTPTTHHVQDALSAVLDLAACGFAVFPCLPGSKHPAFPGGFKNGTTNPGTIRRWWLANPTYNIGIRTGVASGVWVLDVDGDDGATSLAQLETKHGPLPDTLT